MASDYLATHTLPPWASDQSRVVQLSGLHTAETPGFAKNLKVITEQIKISFGNKRGPCYICRNTGNVGAFYRALAIILSCNPKAKIVQIPVITNNFTVFCKIKIFNLSCMETGSVKERLIRYLAYKKLGQGRFEKSIGVSNGFVNNIRSSIQPDRLQKIAQLYPDLNIAWLMVGDELGGKMLKESEQKQKPEAPAKEVHSLPLIPFDAVAGPGDPVYEDERIEDYYTVSEFKESDFLIRVKGDSMAPHFTGGDLLACKKVVDAYFFQWGRCYVVYTRSQGCMVKRVQPSEREGYIKCVSDNVKYAPFDVPMDDIVSVALVNGSISLE